MLSAADNELLTRTGPDEPMGRYFRRFWQPVALSEEVASSSSDYIVCLPVVWRWRFLPWVLQWCTALAVCRISPMAPFT